MRDGRASCMGSILLPLPSRCYCGQAASMPSSRNPLPACPNCVCVCVSVRGSASTGEWIELEVVLLHEGPVHVVRGQSYPVPVPPQALAQSHEGLHIPLGAHDHDEDVHPGHHMQRPNLRPLVLLREAGSVPLAGHSQQRVRVAAVVEAGHLCRRRRPSQALGVAEGGRVGRGQGGRSGICLSAAGCNGSQGA